MKVYSKVGGFQGDVWFEPVVELPPGVREVARDDGVIVVAHSETGHHHVIDRARDHVRYYDDAENPLVSYIHVPGAAPPGGLVDVVHQRAWDTHETVGLVVEPGTVWRVRRQREWVPEGWQRVAD